ncbi:hypothetical protein PIROE2DRAFT_3914 [Piromyces sp. E2]|nr:hypothetical protein PIROE2DRAFT_3914 [Piromyces sp. E2]|eukprot:OUM68454.1 hypothetical protein PIROE2DRAFT_3914 [Piromyces sp. E2]
MIFLHCNDKKSYRIKLIYLCHIKTFEIANESHKYNEKLLQLIKNSDSDGNILINPLLEAVNNNDTETVILLINYANNNDYILDVNAGNGKGNIPFVMAYSKNNFRVVELIMDYAKQHNIFLDVNSIFDEIKKNNDLLLYINGKYFKLFVDYANFQNIILNINEKFMNGENFLSVAVKNNDYEMVKMIIDYANEHNIILDISTCEIKDTFKINMDIMFLLLKYSKDNNIDINLNIQDFQLKKYYNDSVIGNTYINV